MLVSMRSTNTENLERLQGTARRIGETVTSRRPSEVPRTVLLRCQAEMEGELHQATEKKETELSRLGQELPPVRNTILERKLLRDAAMNANFEGLLKTISLFMRCGKGVWWDYVGTHIMFFDGNREPEFRPEGPHLRHLRSSTLESLQQEMRDAWKEIKDKDIELPKGE